jgi:Fe-S-cluster formation regulator IscX/YfhJ
MIYAAKTDNYVGTFNQLKTWISQSDKAGKSGELPFHKAFVSTLFKDLPELSTTVDIELSCREDYREKLFEALASKVLGWKNEDRYTRTTQRPEKLAVNFVDFHSFIVNLRNRYFHYSNAQSENLMLEEIVDSELLFSMVNKAGFYYVATIFNRIVIHQTEI